MLFTGDEAFPGIAAFANNLFSILLILAFTTESELILRLSIWDLVDTEPFVGCSEKAWEMTFDILDVIKFGRKRVVELSQVSLQGPVKRAAATHIDDNDLPVRLLLIKKCHDTENLDLLNLTGVADKFANLADVQRIVVTLGLGLWMDDIGILPGLLTVSHL